MVNEAGQKKEILTFGPICVEPEQQRRGYGKTLMEHSFTRAVELGYDAIVIFGSPTNYVARGFQSCKKFRVSAEGGKYPAAMLVKELIPADAVWITIEKDYTKDDDYRRITIRQEG